LLVVFALWVALPAWGADAVSFRRDVAPILVKQCQGCHGPEKSKGGYRLDSFDRLTKAGESKTAPVVAGQPAKSNLYRLITADSEDDRMPQKADPLPAAQVTLIRRWIAEGAKFDGPDAAASLASIVPNQEHPAPPEAYRYPIPVTAIALSPDGKTLAASGYNEVTLWDPADGRLLGRIKRVAERTYGLAFSPDGKTLAVAGGAPGTLGEVRLCDVERRDAGRVIERIGDVMLAVRFSPDGKHLAAGGADNAIRVYAQPGGERELLIEQHADWVTDLAYSPDGAKLASASRDRSARVFDAKTGAMQSAFLNHEEAVFGVTWLANGKTLASAGRDHKVRFWDAADAKELGKGTALDAEPQKLVSGLGDVFCAASNGSVRVYSAQTREIVKTLAAPGDWAYSLAVDESAKRLIVGYHGGRVRVFEPDSGKLVNEFVASPGFGGK
jgi:WD40 repeat protein